MITARTSLPNVILLLFILTCLPSDKARAAEDDWIGRKTASTRPASQSSPSLAGKEIDIPGLAGCEVNLKAADIVPQMRFSADGRHLFVLEKKGILHKISFPQMVESATLAIGSRCSSLSESGDGLLVLLDGKEQIWLVDTDTLAVVGRMELPGVTAITASPARKVAWAKIGSVVRKELAAIDPKNGKVLRQASLAGWGAFHIVYPNPDRFAGMAFPPVTDLVTLAATQDGKYLIVRESRGRLCRYLVQGANLVPGEAQWIAQNGTDEFPFTLSDDSQYVATWHANRQIFKISDFSKPILQGDLQTESSREALAFDRQGQKLYVGGSSHPALSTVNARGQFEKAFYLPDSGDESRQILVSPRGDRLLLLTQNKLFNMQFLAAAAANVTSKPTAGKLGVSKELISGEGVQITSLAGLTESDKPADENTFPGWSNWSEDGASLYWLGRNRRLCKILLDDCSVSVSTEFPYQPQWLLWSSEGLLTLAPKAQELLVIDPNTLQTKQAIPVPQSPEITAMACCRSLNKVLLCYENLGEMRWIDLRRGALPPFPRSAIKGLLQADWPAKMLKIATIEGKLRAADLARQVSLADPLLTPDGKRLFTGTSTIFAFDLAGNDLVMKTASPGAPFGRKTASPDGRYLSISKARMSPEGASPKPAILAYEVSAFPRVAASVQTANIVMRVVLGNDLRAYAITKTQILSIYDLATGKVRDVKLPENSWMLDPHPGGKVLLACGQSRVMLLRLDMMDTRSKDNPK